MMALMEGDKCGIEIAGFVDHRTRGRVQIGPATLYTLLGKFEKEKYICEVAVEGRKRTYQITGKGARAYREEWERLKQCVRDAEGE